MAKDDNIIESKVVVTGVEKAIKEAEALNKAHEKAGKASKVIGKKMTKAFRDSEEGTKKVTNALTHQEVQLRKNFAEAKKLLNKLSQLKTIGDISRVGAKSFLTETRTANRKDINIKARERALFVDRKSIKRKAIREADNEDLKLFKRVSERRLQAEKGKAIPNSASIKREAGTLKAIKAQIAARRTSEALAKKELALAEKAKEIIKQKVVAQKKFNAEQRASNKLGFSSFFGQQTGKFNSASQGRKKPTGGGGGKTPTGRGSRIDNILKDGGASLFKVQAQLIGNYLLMSKTFELMRFSSQFILDLDKSFVDLQAILRLTDVEAKNLGDSLVEVSKKTKFTAVEVSQAALELGRAGLNTAQIQQAIEPITLLATAVGSDLKTATDLATSTLAIFNLQASETAQIADIVTGAVTKSKLTIDKLQLGLQFSGNAAAAAGITLSELTATLGALANAGIKSGSMLGTGLRKVIIELEAPSKKLRAQLLNVGLTLEDINIRANTLSGVLQTMRDAGFGAAQAFKSMDIRSASAFLALSSQIDTLGELEAEFLNTNVAVTANEIQMKSLSNQIDKLKSVWGGFIVKALAPATAAFTGLVKATSAVLDVLDNYPKTFAAITTGLGFLFGSFLVGRMALFLGNLIKIRETFIGAAIAANGLKATMLALSTGFSANPVLLGLAALAAGVAIVTTVFGEAKTSADELNLAISDSNRTYTEAKDKLKSIGTAMVRLNDRYKLLSSNSTALKTEVARLSKAYGGFSEQMNNSENSIDGVINALGRLNRATLLSQKNAGLTTRGLKEKQLAGIANSQRLGGVSGFFSRVTPGHIIGDRPRLSQFRNFVTGLNSLSPSQGLKAFEDRRGSFQDLFGKNSKDSKESRRLEGTVRERAKLGRELSALKDTDAVLKVRLNTSDTQIRAITKLTSQAQRVNNLKDLNALDAKVQRFRTELNFKNTEALARKNFGQTSLDLGPVKAGQLGAKLTTAQLRATTEAITKKRTSLFQARKSDASPTEVRRAVSDQSIEAKLLALQGLRNKAMEGTKARKLIEEDILRTKIKQLQLDNQFNRQDIQNIRESGSSSPGKDKIAILKKKSAITKNNADIREFNRLLSATPVQTIEQLAKAMDDVISLNLQQKTQDFFKQFVTGAMSAKDAIKGLAVELLSMAANVAIKSFFSDIFSGVSKGKSGGIFGTIVSAFIGGIGGGSSGSSGPSVHMPKPKPFAHGGRVGGIQKIDSIPAVLKSDEFVMQASSARALGFKNLDAMNQSGKLLTKGVPVPVGVGQTPTAQVTNVYVVSEKPRQGLTKDDVIVTITDDMSRGGVTKQLVKSIVNGG